MTQKDRPEIYLDNCASTKTTQKAAEKIMDMLVENYGNPSSLHRAGLRAELELEKARERIAAFMGADKTCITFTSGGTEANNLALMGSVQAKKRRGTRIVAAANQHHSVIVPLKKLESEGFLVHWIQPGSDSLTDPEKLAAAVTPDTILISLMHVNNETGGIEPVEQAVKMIRRKNPGTLIHCDAVQSFGKIPFRVSALDVDLLSVSAHKIHGPKGVGALYIKKGVRVLPILFGGGHERGLRPGTEAAALIAGFGEAVAEIGDIQQRLAHFKMLNGYLLGKLSECKDILINSPEGAAPYVVNFSVMGIRSEIMLHHLSAAGIYVSSGSACSKGQKSHVLSGMGLDYKRIDSALRVSFSRYNTKEDIDALILSIREGQESLSR